MYERNQAKDIELIRPWPYTTVQPFTTFKQDVVDISLQSDDHTMYKRHCPAGPVSMSRVLTADAGTDISVCVMVGNNQSAEGHASADAWDME